MWIFIKGNTSLNSLVGMGSGRRFFFFFYCRSFETLLASTALESFCCFTFITNDYVKHSALTLFQKTLLWVAGLTQRKDVAVIGGIPKKNVNISTIWNIVHNLMLSYSCRVFTKVFFNNPPKRRKQEYSTSLKTWCVKRHCSSLKTSTGSGREKKNHSEK